MRKQYYIPSLVPLYINLKEKGRGIKDTPTHLLDRVNKFLQELVTNRSFRDERCPAGLLKTNKKQLEIKGMKKHFQ